LVETHICPICRELVQSNTDDFLCKYCHSTFTNLYKNAILIESAGSVPGVDFVRASTMSTRARAKRAVSTVISSVVLVAVAITIAVAVTGWMEGIPGQYMKLEKVEIHSSVCTWNSTGGFWKIGLSLKNTGTSSATFITAFVNEAEVQNYGVDAMVAGQTSTNMNATTSITSGASVVLNVYIAQGYASLSTATTVNIKIHSAGGMDYMALVQLV